MWSALLRLIIYVGLVIAPVVVSTMIGHHFDNAVQETGKCMALAGIMILVLQPFLAARFKWIERPFGLDILIRFHKHMAVFGVFLLLFHPVLLAAGAGRWHLLIGLDLPWYIWLAKGTLLILLINLLVSIYQTSLNLKFEKWRMIHDILGPLIIVFAFTHSWFAGDDLELTPMKVFWVAALVPTVLVYLYHRIYRPLQLKRHAYRVIDVTPESKDVWTVKLSPPQGDPIYPYLPGQFHFITFYRGKNLPEEEHHWTISSSPSEKNYVSSTIKASGDFTATMGQTRAGDTAAVHGAFGRFSYVFHPEDKDLVFIAGGIGITPLMSMLRHMRDTGDKRSVLLLYANSSENDIVFHEQLSDMERGPHPLLKVVHVLSRPEGNWTGETGHVDREKIERFCGHALAGKGFYLCGPMPMQAAVIADLKNLGVSRKQIRSEIFSFLD